MGGNVFVIGEPDAARRVLPIFVVDAATGLPTNISIDHTNVQLHKRGGSWVNSTNDPVALTGQDGAWELDLVASEINTKGPLGWRVVKTGIRTVVDWENVVDDIEGRPVSTVVTDIGNSTTAFKTALTNLGTNFWRDAWCCFRSGANAEQVHQVVAYDPATKILTFATAFTTIPLNGDRFVMVNR